ncbi:MAG: DUF4173 domain-containing protein [Herbinix sp.]|nr:DUF4173 domain-containing protein [Herbinix sp.]
MEKLNTVLPETQEEIKPAVEAAFERKQESPLLNQVRQKFGFYGGISLVFGGIFAMLFYKTWIGLNVFLFTSVIIILLCIIMKKLSLRVKTGTRFYFAGAILLAISSCLTSSAILLLFNIVGILILLDLTLLHQLYEDHRWDFLGHFGRMLRMIIYSIACIGMPFIDMINFMKKVKIFKNDKTRNIVIGTLISLPILLIITALLSEADLLFGKLTEGLLGVVFSADILAIAFLILFGFLASYCILCGALYNTHAQERKPIARADASIAATFMILLCLVYAVFCSIQLIYLFANGLFILPKEFTFAEYARRGFFELLAVTVINIVIILLCGALFKESKLLRVLVTFMTFCTYIMIVSATYRMFLYIGAYHLTFLRLFVLLSLLIDAFVLAGVITSEYNKKFPLFRYCVIVTTVWYVIFSFARPDYYIASYLVSQKAILDIEDLRYLTGELSLDAAPIVLSVLGDTERWSLDNQPEEEVQYDEEMLERSYYYETDIQYKINYYERITNAKSYMSFRDFNYANFKAAQYADQYPNK